MTAFDDLFGRTALPCLQSQYGERITYYPRNGNPRTITAMVDRNPPEDGGPFEESRGPRFVIECENDQQIGIASECIDTGGDRVEFAARKGGPVTKFAVVQLLDDDAGMVRIEVR